MSKIFFGARDKPPKKHEDDMTETEKKLDEARDKLTKTILKNCPDSSKTSEILDAVKGYSRLVVECTYEKCNAIWNGNFKIKAEIVETHTD